MKSFKLTSKSLPKLSDEYGDCDQEGGGGGGGMPRSWEWPSLPVILLERDAVSEAMWTPVSLSCGEEEPVEDVNPSSAWNAGDRRALRTAMIFIFSCSEADCRAPVTNGHCRFLSTLSSNLQHDALSNIPERPWISPWISISNKSSSSGWKRR